MSSNFFLSEFWCRNDSECEVLIRRENVKLTRVLCYSYIVYTLCGNASTQIKLRLGLPCLPNKIVDFIDRQAEEVC